MTTATTSLITSPSYYPHEITFLLSPITMSYTSVDEKEKLIQTGEKHYSEMLSKEAPPSEQHLHLYRNAMEQFGERLATEVIALAKGLQQESVPNKPIILISLVRAGVPLAVCLWHALRDLKVEALHYGISIIRDKGIDKTALNHIIEQHGTDNLFFIDGWTGKGAIAQELKRSLQLYTPTLTPRLVVLADPCGQSWMASSKDDWLIPFGILGAPIAGLISRSIWQEHNLHSVMICNHLKQHDLTRDFIESVNDIRMTLDPIKIPAARSQTIEEHSNKNNLQILSNKVISTLAKNYNVDNINRIKPGIAEATRAVMRRIPDHILVNNRHDPDIQLLCHLAQENEIPVEERPNQLGIYRAVTIIKKVI